MFEDLENRIAQLQARPSPCEPAQIRERFELLDHLDSVLGDDGSSTVDQTCPDAESLRRLLTLRAQLEASNEELFRSSRAEIQQGTQPSFFRKLISDADPAPGLSFDYRDELLSGILALDEPDPLPTHPPDGMVFYQPTPARYILDLVRQAAFADSDVLIDLGSGLGHVPLLVSICTGAHCIGIDREEAYIRTARAAASALHLQRVSFTNQDAREADLSRGTIFYLYTPFTGSILAAVLHRLHHESAQRPIRVCTFGPGTQAVAQELWLRPLTPPDPTRITIFASSSSG